MSGGAPASSRATRCSTSSSGTGSRRAGRQSGQASGMGTAYPAAAPPARMEVIRLSAGGSSISRHVRGRAVGACDRASANSGHRRAPWCAGPTAWRCGGETRLWLAAGWLALSLRARHLRQRRGGQQQRQGRAGHVAEPWRRGSGVPRQRDACRAGQAGQRRRETRSLDRGPARRWSLPLLETHLGLRARDRQAARASVSQAAARVREDGRGLRGRDYRCTYINCQATADSL